MTTLQLKLILVVLHSS